MFAKDYRAAAWKKLTGNWTNVVVAYLIYVVLIGALSSTGIGSLILGGPLAIGMVILLLKLSRTGESKIENVFDGFKNGIGSNIVAGILVPLFTFLWALLLIIPGIVKSYSYAMTYYILADHPEMSPTEAITKSREMMKGNKWRLFCLDFSFIGWYLLSILTLGILLLWIDPYHMMAHAAFYESLKEAAPQDDAFVGGMASDEGTTQL
ncbi:MAG: DUF975 family protein [Clostridia bacterium]|nr:DUF975 family protein [Clostridia bacterium]